MLGLIRSSLVLFSSFSLVWFLWSSSVLFGPFRSYSVLFSSFGPLPSYLAPFDLIWSIRPCSVQSVLFGLIQSSSVHSVMFGLARSCSVHLLMFGPFSLIRSCSILFGPVWLFFFFDRWSSLTLFVPIQFYSVQFGFIQSYSVRSVLFGLLRF